MELWSPQQKDASQRSGHSLAYRERSAAKPAFAGPQQDISVLAKGGNPPSFDTVFTTHSFKFPLNLE